MMDTKVVPGSSEIIEIEALIPGKHHRGGSFMEPELKREEENRRSLASNAGKIASLEEDLNQLFEIFNSRSSSIRHSHENQATTSKRNSSKKHVKSRASHSSAHEISERVNLKQALRGLCISQASELASMKRSMKSPRSSEAERIMSMYRSVVEDSNPEKSLGPERRVSDPFPRTPKKSPSLDLWPSKRNSLADKAVGPATTMHNEAVKLPAEKVVVAAAVEAGQRKSKVDMIYQDRKSQSPCYSDDSHDKGLSTETLHDKRYDDPPCSSRSSYGKTSLDPARKMAEQKRISASPKEEHPCPRSLSTSDLGEKFSDLSEDSVDPSKVVAKEAKVASKKTEKSRSKPPIRSKNLVKSGSKKNQSLDNCSKNTPDEFDSDQYASPNPIVCPRCQCVVTDAWKEPSIDSSVSNQHSSESQESVVFYEDSPMSPCASISGTSSDGLDKSKTIFVECTSNSRSRDKMEFTRSSEGSPGEYSSNTTVSQESTLSRPSFCDRPHMSKDVRWEAICLVRSQHGALGLKNFSLLKKLGCGDIGTVYLTELIGTNCLFAVKVMDNEFLARRKKITRAQTEKEILRMLDHPFLPTLYCKFTSDNLSCLVMEYCPGGDLHVLRQKQVGKCFTEQAARFYVAEVLLALEYLHMLGVIYRDLKPENILVREDGHIMLSDFDLSLRCAVSPALLVSSSTSEGTKNTNAPRDSHSCSDSRCAATCQVTCFTSRHSRKQKTNAAAEMRPLLQLVAEPTTARSNSFVGTHEYLAPEIIKGEGHGSAVDWWTFGIFLYELLYGRTPFKGADNEETLANVVLQSLKFPDCPLVSLQARELIAALLVKEPEHRLGTERGATDIKQHPFFEGLNWALIRCAVPPELPEPQTNVSANAVSSETTVTVNNAELEFGVF